MLDEKEPTQYGPLGRLPALAAQLVIHRTSVAAIIALDTVHLALGLRRDRAATIPPSQTPSDRWYQMRIWLFGSLDDDAGATASRLPLPLTVPLAEERTIDQLLGAAGNFLLAESRKLEDQIDTWLAVEFGDEVPSRMIDEVADMRAGIIIANNAAQKLLRMVGRGTWQEALDPQMEATAEPQIAEPRLEVVHPAASRASHVFVAMPFGSRSSMDSIEERERDAHRCRAVQVAVDSVWRQLSQSVVVIADFAGAAADAAAGRVIAWAEDLVAVDVPLGEIVLSEVVVTAVDGRQTDPIALEYGPSRRLRDECRSAILAAVRATALLARPERFSPSSDTASILERTEDLASALAFAVDTIEPHRMLIVSDLPAPTDLDLDATTELFASSAELQAHSKRLRDSSLSFAEIAVTVAPIAHPASLELWRALCGDNAKLALLSRLQDNPTTVHGATPARTVAPTTGVSCRTNRGAPQRSPSPQGITVLVHLDEKPPRRVLAKASALVVTISLALALAGTGAGFALAGTGPVLPATLGVLIGLGSGAVSLLWARRTESVTALSSVTSAAVRVLGPDPLDVVATSAETDVTASDHDVAAHSERSLV
ncbi:hypothetical protein [Lentzea terrae]|uniref:hypothetical protein n=1 Tax=Lentzea terrae TaxID=2200761 RepID=UPI000DD2F874|nr:hypothetical protein [Lentzea terrae]